MLVSRALFIDSLLMDCYVSISRTVLGFAFDGLLRWYLMHCFRILFGSIVRLVSRALL